MGDKGRIKTKGSVEAHPFLVEHIDPLNLVLRDEDRLEIYLASGQSPENLLYSIASSTNPKRFFSLFSNGRIVGAFGVLTVNLPKGLGAPWFLASEELVQKHWRQLVRETPTWAYELGRGHQSLQNVAWRGNLVHIKWLTRIGAKFIEEIPRFGFAKKAFVRFSLDQYCATHSLARSHLRRASND